MTKYESASEWGEICLMYCCQTFETPFQLTNLAMPLQKSFFSQVFLCLTTCFLLQFNVHPSSHFFRQFYSLSNVSVLLFLLIPKDI